MKISKEVIELVNKSEEEVQTQFKEVEKICEKNTYKVLKAFQENNLLEEMLLKKYLLKFSIQKTA